MHKLNELIIHEINLKQINHKDRKQGLLYRAEPPDTGRTEPDWSLTDPVRAYFLENDLEETNPKAEIIHCKEEDTCYLKALLKEARLVNRDRV